MTDIAALERGNLYIGPIKRGTTLELRAIHRTIGLLCCILLAGCGAKSSFTLERGSSQNVADIKSVYVYAFLDARRSFTGEPFLKEFEQQLQQRFREKNIAVEWLWYEDSRIGRALSLEEVQKEKGGSQVMIPVPLVVMSNSLAEQAAQTSHRLIVFPKMVGLTGIRQAQKQYYATIAWSIVDTANSREVFKGSSSLVSKPGWEGSEEVHEDVNELVDDFVNALYPSNASR